MASLYVPSRTGITSGNGYKLYFYQTGTTTPIDTYSQSDLAVGHKNTNPVVADSNGLFGPIYLLATPDYKVVMTDASGTTIWTTDPILTAAAAIITTRGDLIVGDNTGTAVRLPIGANQTYLRSDGTDASWHTLAAADLTGTLAVGVLPSATILQVKTVSSNTYTSTTGTIPYDDTVPQIGEGTALSALNLSITPSSTSSKVLVEAFLSITGGANFAAAAVFRAGGANAIVANAFVLGADVTGTMPLIVLDSPSSVSSQAYTVRYGGSGTQVSINGISSGRLFGGSLISSMRLTEIAG